MRLLLLLLVVTITLSCDSLRRKPLQLISPNLKEAYELNKVSETYIDGIYSHSDTITSLIYSTQRPPYKEIYVSYRPVVVAKDFKFIYKEKDVSGKDVVIVNLHEDVHQRWYDATLEAYKKREFLFIVFEGKILSAPYVYAPITEGKIQLNISLSEEKMQLFIDNFISRNSK